MDHTEGHACKWCKVVRAPAGFNTIKTGPRKGLPKIESRCRYCDARLSFSWEVYQSWPKNKPYCEVRAAQKVAKMMKAEGLSEHYATHAPATSEEEYLLRALASAKARATAKGIPFSLSMDTIPRVPATCPALGIPLVPSTKIATDNSPSLDRMVPSRGYVPGNVRWLSNRANRIKTDASIEEIRAVEAWLSSQLPPLQLAA